METESWGLIVGVVGVLATVIGLGIAIAQIRKTRKAAEAAQRALTTTEARLARTELLELIPKLADVDKALELSVEEGSRTDTADALTSWRDKAHEILGLLEEREYGSGDLKSELTSSATRVVAVRGELPEDTDERFVATKEVRAEVSTLCGQLNQLKANLKIKTSEDIS